MKFADCSCLLCLLLRSNCETKCCFWEVVVCGCMLHLIMITMIIECDNQRWIYSSGCKGRLKFNDEWLFCLSSRLPASYVFQPTAYGGAPLLSLPTTTTSPALAAALASASGNHQMSQFYDYQPTNLTASGVGGQGAGNAAAHAAAAAAAFSSPAAAHFAATQAAFAASDPYASYLAAAAGGQPHGSHNAAAAAYAAYLPQVAASAMPAGAGGAGGPTGGIHVNPYGAVTTDTRMQ